MLKKYHPLFINTHFNHPDELTPAAVAALGLLADAGIPLGCQTVLLKGVNDDPAVMKELMQRLLDGPGPALLHLSWPTRWPAPSTSAPRCRRASRSWRRSAAGPAASPSRTSSSTRRAAAARSRSCRSTS